jgi:phospholipid/cholesterol/gamma-HCH transport system substrate-binding protein
MRRRNDVIVGIVVLASLALILFGTIWMRGLGFGREEQEIQARFHTVGQLLRGSKVKLRGVMIGRVQAIELEATGRAVIVTMRVRSDVRMPEDPVVVLAPESMFGDWQAEIFPRTSFPHYAYAEAPDPLVLPGYALPDMSRLTAVADEIAQNMRVLSDRFETAFTEETADHVRLAIQNIQEVSEQLTGLVSGQARAIQEVSDNLQETTEALGDAAATVRRAFEQAELAIGGGRLEGIMANVHNMTAQADSIAMVLLQTSREMRIAAAAADTTFRRVGSIADAVERGEGTLGMLVRDTALYRSIVMSKVEVQALLRDIRENPRRYINVRVF